MHEFKKYSTDLPLGPLEVDNESTYTCDDITHVPTCNETPPPVTSTELRVSSGLQYDSCNCTEPINLPPVLIPIKDTAPVHVTSSKDNDVVQDVIHTRRCNRQIQLARSERNDALRLAQLYRNKVEELVKDKKNLKHSYEEQLNKTRDFWRNHIMEGGTRAGRMVRAALLRKDLLEFDSNCNYELC